MDFAKDKQMGRTRVNFVSDSKKNRKTHVQSKKNKMTGFDKLCQLQNIFFKEGMSFEDYENYIQGKINDEKYYYKNISNDDIEKLKKRYRKMHTTKENKLNLLLSERNRKIRQTKLFKEKKKNLINEQKRGVIDALFKEINVTNAIGITRSTDILSNDPEKFTETKKYLFTGGRYFEGQDKGWLDIYKKLVSNNSANLFDLHSPSALNDHVYNR
jgi:hypothetical protein